MKVLLLAGGNGTRLWPYSKADTPKQILHLFMKFTPLQNTLKRFIDKIPLDDLFIITRKEHLDVIKHQVRLIAPLDDKQFILEPCSKNTAPAIAWAACHLLASDQLKMEEPLLIVPTDHILSDSDHFITIFQEVLPLAKSDQILIFGVTPLRADEGLGYIQVKDPLSKTCYSVKSFVEKPPLELAERYLESGDWFWNTGIFLLSPQTLFKHFELFNDHLYQFSLSNMADAKTIFQSLQPISIDHAIIEKSSKLRLVSLDPIQWLDIGSWDNLYEILEKDHFGNAIIGNVIHKNCKNCLLVSENKTLSASNLNHMIVIETNDASLITEKKPSQKSHKIAENLKKGSKLLPV